MRNEIVEGKNFNIPTTNSPYVDYFDLVLSRIKERNNTPEWAVGLMNKKRIECEIKKTEWKHDFKKE